MPVILNFLLAILYLVLIIAFKATRRLPVSELHQRSRQQHDKAAGNLSRLVSYGSFADFSLSMLAGLSAAGLLYSAYSYQWWLGLVAVLALGATIVFWQPVRKLGGLGWRVGGITGGLLAKLLMYIKPVAEFYNRHISSPNHGQTSTTIYQKNDLLDLLKDQAKQPDNRIDPDDLRRATKALTYPDKLVKSLMLPRAKIKWVEAGEKIGPSIMDELHQAGQQRFALVKSAKGKPEILGTLYIGDLLKHLDKKSTLKDLMHPRAAYINEDYYLDEALDAMLKTGNLMLVCLNSREEITGLLTIEQLIGESIGRLKSTDFNDYDDPRLVAARVPDDKQ